MTEKELVYQLGLIELEVILHGRPPAEISQRLLDLMTKIRLSGVKPE